MTERDGTPLPWGGRQGNLGVDLSHVGADNPLDQLCDALHVRRPKGVERIRAMDAFGRLMNHWNEAWAGGQPDDPGIDRTLPPGTVFGG